VSLAFAQQRSCEEAEDVLGVLPGVIVQALGVAGVDFPEVVGLVGGAGVDS
jgi:hypothetical protein